MFSDKMYVLLDTPLIISTGRCSTSSRVSVLVTPDSPVSTNFCSASLACLPSQSFFASRSAERFSRSLCSAADLGSPLSSPSLALAAASSSASSSLVLLTTSLVYVRH
jgi:hypothetical protein